MDLNEKFNDYCKNMNNKIFLNVKKILEQKLIM
jgi:hypothetical protein